MVLSLGRTPLANALLRPEQLDQPERTYPLELAFCPHCSLVQITRTVPPEQLFRRYAYASSFSETMLRHSRTLAGRIIRSRRIRQDSLVLEIGSNDGYLLQFYRRAGIPVLGIEPAENIARMAVCQRGIPTLREFFGIALARSMARTGRLADVVHANNVLAHVPDLNGFVAGMAIVLKADGVAVIEVPYVRDLIDRVEFDTIYHEHLCYFSLTALDRVFRRHGLRIADVERIAIHGGSLRVFVDKAGVPSARPRAPSVRNLLAEEAAWGIDRPASYLGFAARVDNLRRDLVGLVRRLRSEKKRIAAYGASAKGSTLLNYFGLGQESLDFVVDRSPVKQGNHTPGTHLKVYPPEKLVEEMPDYVLLLTWNFADEILRQQQDYRAGGGRFIIPIPEVKVA
jgi:SAM-dependent methyltransferase